MAVVVLVVVQSTVNEGQSLKSRAARMTNKQTLITQCIVNVMSIMHLKFGREKELSLLMTKVQSKPVICTLSCLTDEDRD